MATIPLAERWSIAGNNPLEKLGTHLYTCGIEGSVSFFFVHQGKSSAEHLGWTGTFRL